jgi:hypothetical protein
MSFMEVVSDAVRNAARDWLRIKEAQPFQAEIEQLLTHEGNAFKNRIWYRGEAYELNQFFKAYANHTHSFWGSVPTAGMEIRKLHSGLPQLIVNTLTSITLADLGTITVTQDGEPAQKLQELWDALAKENKAEKLFKRATTETLIAGDGAFKLTLDSTLSGYPLIEYVAGESIEYATANGRISEVIFKTPYRKRDETYILWETYGYGYVFYRLTKNDREVPLSTLPQTAGLTDVAFDRQLMMAVPFCVSESVRYPGRGQSLYEGKSDPFDALDECLSQWVDALRAGRTKTYIPESLVPRNPRTGEPVRPNTFDNRFITIGDDTHETGTNKIDVEQPTIPSENYVETYTTFLDLSLQGVISPSTLGIDVKKLDNAEAQREKEKATLYTRQAIVDALQEVIPQVIECAINTYRVTRRQAPIAIGAEVSFGEYANPSFEAQVETLSNPNTPMSVEARVEELWGAQKDDEWKAAEVALIKAQQGLERFSEPDIGFGGGSDGLGL